MQKAYDNDEVESAEDFFRKFAKINEINYEDIKIFFDMFFCYSTSQEIQKGGKKPTSFTYDEALEMIKARDAQWEGKLAKADTLIEMYKVYCFLI